MPRERLCKVCRQWHPLDEWPAECANHSAPKRASHLNVPMINHDTMDAVQSQTNGMYYESKSALRSEYKRAGVVELGNDAPTVRKAPPPPDKQGIKAAVHKAFSKAGLGA